MMSFRAGAGSGEDWPSACDACLETLGGLSEASNLGIVYASGPLAHALDLITARLQEATGIRNWVGTGGSGVCSSSGEVDGEAAIAVLTAALPNEGFRLFDGLSGNGDDQISWKPEAGPVHLAIVHGDPRQTKIPTMIESLGEATGAFLVGGLTSTAGNGAMQIAGRPTEGGLSGVLLSDAIPAITGITQSCTPIGPVREITGIDGPWITTLDGEPALRGLEQDVGPMLARNMERVKGFIMAARSEGDFAQKDYLVRDLGDIDPLRGFIMVGDEFRHGDQLGFVKRDPEAARSDLRRLSADLRKRAEGRPILGGLYHSCIGRGRHIFGTERAELQIIEEELGPIPLAGFSTHGEIFRNQLYGYAAVLTLFLAGQDK